MKLTPILFCMALAACARVPDMPLQVLVCSESGRVTYRSNPSRYWVKSSSGVWNDATWQFQYGQSAFESCYTERVP